MAKRGGWGGEAKPRGNGRREKGRLINTGERSATEQDEAHNGTNMMNMIVKRGSDASYGYVLIPGRGSC